TPAHLTGYNGILYFSDGDLPKPINNNYNVELWRSDGTNAGTYKLDDINQVGADTYYDSNPKNFTVANNLLYFTAETNTAGPIPYTDLWQTDGTLAGTVRVFTVNVDSTPSNLTVSGDYLYFSAENSTGRELWGLRLGNTLPTIVNDSYITSED